MDPVELSVHRANTKAFIDANPSQVTLTPRTAHKTGNGVRYEEGAPRAAQTMRVIDQTRAFGPEPGTIVAGDGKQARLEYQLLGEWDAVIGKNDVWTDASGIQWVVIDLLPDQDYERRAQVMRYGES